MMNDKRLLLSASAALLAVVAALCVAGCDGKKDGQEKLKIGFLVKQAEEPWFQNEWKFAQQCADKYGFELIKIDVKDGEKVLTAIDTLGARGAKGFVICTPDVKLGPAIVRAAKRNDLKVYAVDDRFLGEDGKPMADVPYMGIDARKIGQTVGQALWDEMRKRGWKIEETAACGITYPDLPTSVARTEGAKEALIEAGFPADKIFEKSERTTDTEGSMVAAAAVLTAHANVKRWLIFSMNDEGVMGAVRAMEGAGFDDKTVIGIGIGGSTCLVDFRKAKPTGFRGTILITPKRHGFETTEYMYKWITEDTKPPMDIRTKGVLVTRDNYPAIYKANGMGELLNKDGK